MSDKPAYRYIPVPADFTNFVTVSFKQPAVYHVSPAGTPANTNCSANPQTCMPLTTHGKHTAHAVQSEATSTQLHLPATVQCLFSCFDKHTTTCSTSSHQQQVHDCKHSATVQHLFSYYDKHKVVTLAVCSCTSSLGRQVQNCKTPPYASSLVRQAYVSYTASPVPIQPQVTNAQLPCSYSVHLFSHFDKHKC